MMTSYPAAIKPRYLRNPASQIKIYYGSLSGSNDHSFRIHHEKSREAPPGGDIMIRHIRLAIKPYYLGNPASQIKSYYIYIYIDQHIYIYTFQLTGYTTE